MPLKKLKLCPNFKKLQLIFILNQFIIPICLFLYFNERFEVNQENSKQKVWFYGRNYSKSYNNYLNKMGCESSMQESIVIEVKKQPQTNKGSITTYPSIQDLVKKQKRRQIAYNMKLWADKKVIFRQIHNEIK